MNLSIMTYHYHVVEFINEEIEGLKVTGVIPEKLLLPCENGQDRCLYPRKNPVPRAWVRDAKLPETSWIICEVKIFKSAGEFQKSEKICLAYTQRSDVEMSSDAGKSRKRRRTAPTRYSPGPGQQELSSGSSSDQSTRSDSPNLLVHFNGEMPSVPPVNSQFTGLSQPAPPRPPSAPYSRAPLHSSLDGTHFQPLLLVYAPFHHPPSCPPHQPSPTPPRNTSSAITSMFERSLEKMFSLMEEIKQKQEVMDHKLDALLQEREDGAGADASGRRKAELPGELDWPLQTPEDVERLEEILSRDEGKRKAMMQ